MNHNHSIEVTDENGEKRVFNDIQGYILIMGTRNEAENGVHTQTVARGVRNVVGSIVDNWEKFGAQLIADDMGFAKSRGFLQMLSKALGFN